MITFLLTTDKKMTGIQQPYHHPFLPPQTTWDSISPKLSELVHLHFNPLIKTIEDDKNRRLPVSLIGRIAIIKMTICFSLISVRPPPTWFNSVDSKITKFNWKNKSPRIKLTTLQKPKGLGGLDGPNFHNYFLANQLNITTRWIYPTNSVIPG